MRKARYEALKKQGICVQCKKVHVEGRVVCKDCQKKNTENKRLRNQRLKEQGLCVRCGKNAKEGKNLCAECTTWYSKSKAEERKLRKELGICIDCGKEKAIKGSVRCLACKMENRSRYKSKTVSEEEKERRAIKDKEKYLTRKEQGLCVRCGKRPKSHGLLCNRCYSSIQIHKERNKSQLLRSERVSYGLCYICGKHPIVEGKGVCESCLAKRREVIKDIMYLSKEEKGLDYWDGLNKVTFNGVKV